MSGSSSGHLTGIPIACHGRSSQGSIERSRGQVPGHVTTQEPAASRDQYPHVVLTASGPRVGADPRAGH